MNDDGWVTDPKFLLTLYALRGFMPGDEVMTTDDGGLEEKNRNRFMVVHSMDDDLKWPVNLSLPERVDEAAGRSGDWDDCGGLSSIAAWRRPPCG